MKFRKQPVLSSLLVTVVIAVSVAIPAASHHGFTGAYDSSQPIYIDGRIEKVTLASPHTKMNVSVLESGSLPEALPELDVLGTADAQPKIEPVAAGDIVTRNGATQTEVEGCEDG